PRPLQIRWLRAILLMSRPPLLTRRGLASLVSSIHSHRHIESEINPGFELECPGPELIGKRAKGNCGRLNIQIRSAGSRCEKSGYQSGIRMIKDILRIHADREALGFLNLYAFLDGHIGCPGAQSINRVLT